MASSKKVSVRPLSVIANEIAKEWKNVNFGAVPYLNAMRSLDSITDTYGMDSAKSIVLYFLSNARSFQGEAAKRIKLELNKMCK
jgi:asparagine synthetase B (glutamine-hydrolysing)